MRIGLVSDTHGLLPNVAFDILKGVDLIVHAGDIGDDRAAREIVISALEALAPLVAVGGNMDGYSESGLDMWNEIDTPNGKLGVTHRAVEAKRVLGHVEAECHARGLKWLVYGHTHAPDVRKANGTLWINPGSASLGRNQSPRSMAILELSEAAEEAKITFYNLETGASYRSIKLS